MANIIGVTEWDPEHVGDTLRVRRAVCVDLDEVLGDIVALGGIV